MCGFAGMRPAWFEVYDCAAMRAGGMECRKHGSFDYRRWAIAWKLMNWELESLYDYFCRAYESVFWISYHTYLPKISALLTFSQINLGFM